MNAGSINKVTDLVTTRIGDSSVAQSVVAKMKDRFRDYIIPQKEIKLRTLATKRGWTSCK